MDVIIYDVVKNNYLTPYNITPEQVIETVINQDVKKTINFPDYIIILFLKKFDSHYILVDGRWKPSSFSLLISSAFIVDQQLIKNLPIDNPLAALEQFAKDFGYEIKIGEVLLLLFCANSIWNWLLFMNKIDAKRILVIAKVTYSHLVCFFLSKGKLSCHLKKKRCVIFC